MSTRSALNPHEWPALPFSDWEGTCDTLHMWTQIVGKTRMELAPPENHWWHVALRVTPRGLGTLSIPYRGEAFDVEFDFVKHQLLMRSSRGIDCSIALYPRSVADFYREYMVGLKSLGIEVEINSAPMEFDDPTPFDKDEHHAQYDKSAVERFHRILLSSDAVFREFRSRFLGKSSPVHFFWGSFDLAVTRFCGRVAPHKDGVDPVTKEAYSHEVISCGWWPGDRRYPKPAFYSYTAPAPAGLDKHPHWNAKLGEFLLDYDEVRKAPDPAAAVMDFCQSTYESGATLANWDRAALERV